MGALATLVATPCTAPFMAAAVGYAITQPWYVSIAVLEAIGLGLALPYLLIAFSSSARSWLPKPGIWMLRLKEILAFPVYGTAVWFMYVLSQQVGAFGTTAALAGLVLVAFAAWLYDAVGLSDGQWRRLGVGLSTLAVVGAFALVSFVDDGGQSNVSRATAGETLDWQAFSQAKFDALRADGRPIFIDFTAAWCITCKVNERIALADPAVVKVFADLGVAALKADCNRQDASIIATLSEQADYVGESAGAAIVTTARASGISALAASTARRRGHARSAVPAPAGLAQVIGSGDKIGDICGEASTAGDEWMRMRLAARLSLPHVKRWANKA